MRNPLILAGAGSVSEVKLICRDQDNREIARLNVPLSSTEWIEVPEGTRTVSIIPIVDLDI